MTPLADNPMKIGWLVPDIQIAGKDFEKQQKTKEILNQYSLIH